MTRQGRYMMTVDPNGSSFEVWPRCCIRGLENLGQAENPSFLAGNLSPYINSP